MKSKQRIFAFHLLNDRSGSPKVLSLVLRRWLEADKEVHLYTTQNQDGFLSNIPGLHFHPAWYQFRANPWLRLLFYTTSQLILISRMSRAIKKNDLVYVNTLLPFGAAILGKLKGAHVVYHIHESTVKPAILKWFLLKIVRLTANEIVNVSKYVQEAHGIKTIPSHLVYNTIEEAFLNDLLPKKISQQPKNVLMVCSLKAYKGVLEFLQLAFDNKPYNFKLVLNATEVEISTFFKGTAIPQNLQLFSSQKDLHPFYQWADIILNLSRPDGWIETFGLTIIEGMAYGLPAIVPPVGGILEVIKEGKSGYSIDARDRPKLNECLKNIMENPERYHNMSIAAKLRLNAFREKNEIPNYGILNKIKNV